jgi:hypothetical protein
MMDLAKFHAFTQVLTKTLKADDRVLALVAIGSLAHLEHIDPWSDHDFWMITIDSAQTAFLTDLSWLPDQTEIALALQPAQQYYTVLYKSGHIAEFAVFGLQDLALGRLSHYRMLFDKDSIAPRIQAIAAQVHQDQQSGYNASAILGHFLVTLCTGAGRAARGESLSANTYIYHYAVDALLTLITHHVPPLKPDLVDPFDPRRRFERAYPDLGTILAGLHHLPPVVAARHMLDLAQELFPDGSIWVGSEALQTTRAYLRMIEEGHI